jgi:hypothetical protein
MMSGMSPLDMRRERLARSETMLRGKERSFKDAVQLLVRNLGISPSLARDYINTLSMTGKVKLEKGMVKA